MKSFLSALTLVAAAALVQPVAAACVSNDDCTDGDVCNGLETCQAGVCVPGGALVCDDFKACTSNICDAGAGCLFPPSPGCMITGRKIKMGARSSLRLTVQAGPEIAGEAFPANDSSGDPVQHGATLRVFTDVGDRFDATYVMPTTSWQYVGDQGANRGYLYKDKANNWGPIKIALIRNGKPSKLKGGGPDLGFTLGGDPNPVNVVLTFGDQSYCLSYGGIARFNPGVGYKAKRSVAPDACPFPAP